MYYTSEVLKEIRQSKYKRIWYVKHYETTAPPASKGEMHLRGKKQKNSLKPS